MKTFTISEEDVAQVRAILLTHAEMQDRQGIENEELRGRLTMEQSEDGADITDLAETITDLREVHDDLTTDRDNLKRIAALFQ